MAPSKLLKIGLIGPGSIADQKLIPAINRIAGAQFWSVCGRDKSRAQTFADRHGACAPQGAQAYDDISLFLADKELDAVIIASPDLLHSQQAIACAAAGKHIFIEKPMATSAVDAEAILQAVTAAGVKLAVGYHLRFHNGHRALARAIRDGELGRPLHLHINWSYLSSPDDWRNNSTTGRWWSMAAVGTHSLDLARFLLSPVCGEIVQSQATLHTDEHGGPHDESSVVSLRFASGATATIISNMNYTATRLVELTGSKGTATAIDTLGPRGSGSISINRRPLEFSVVDPYEGELSAFVLSLKGTGDDASGTDSGLDLLVGAALGKENINLLESISAGGQS